MAKLSFETPFNHYSVVSNIGEGGSGKVYKVSDSDGSLFAVKCLEISKSTKQKSKRFKNEIFFCLQNSHKNIITVLDYGVARINDAECPFYVMPCYTSTLRELMKVGISPNKVIPYFSQIVDGVEAAHLKKIWHRDLKPENILYDPVSDLLVVADFGIAHFGEEYLQTSIATEPNTRLANFRYAAPEQRTAGQLVDQRADIYALGLILYEMFTGMLLQGTGYALVSSSHKQYAYVDQLIDEMVRQRQDDRLASLDTVKQKLVAYGNDFVVRQKISQLSNVVIPQLEVDDLLVRNPIQVIDVDYQKGKLIFTLSSPVNSKWQNAFGTIDGYSFFMGSFEPRFFDFNGNQAMINMPNEIPDQGMVDMFKDYVVKANENYKRRLITELREREQAEKSRIKKELDEETLRQKVRQSLKV